MPATAANRNIPKDSVVEAPLLIAKEDIPQGDKCFSEESHGKQEHAFMVLPVLAYN